MSEVITKEVVEKLLAEQTRVILQAFDNHFARLDAIFDRFEKERQVKEKFGVEITA